MVFENLVKDSGPVKIFDEFVLALCSRQQKYSYVKSFYDMIFNVFRINYSQNIWSWQNPPTLDYKQGGIYHG